MDSRNLSRAGVWSFQHTDRSPLSGELMAFPLFPGWEGSVEWRGLFLGEAHGWRLERGRACFQA
jgi:hypothetical protein